MVKAHHGTCLQKYTLKLTSFLQVEAFIHLKSIFCILIYFKDTTTKITLTESYRYVLHLDKDLTKLHQYSHVTDQRLWPSSFVV